MRGYAGEKAVSCLGFDLWTTCIGDDFDDDDDAVKRGCIHVGVLVVVAGVDVEE